MWDKRFFRGTSIIPSLTPVILVPYLSFPRRRESRKISENRRFPAGSKNKQLPDVDPLLDPRLRGGDKRCCFKFKSFIFSACFFSKAANSLPVFPGNFPGQQRACAGVTRRRGAPPPRKGLLLSIGLLGLLFLGGCPRREAPHMPHLVLAPHQMMVAQGETVYSIAYKKGISTRALIEVNRLQAPYTLLPGQILVIPEPEAFLEPVAPRVDSPPLFGQEPDAPLVLHKSLEPLPPQAVGKPAPRPPQLKQEVTLPPRMSSDMAPDIARELDLEQARLAGGKEKQVAAAAPLPQPINQKPSPQELVAAGESQKFSWPVQGKVIGKYGRGEVGGDGIRIAAAAGTPIHAILKGKVIYAGSEIKNLGNLVLIEHDGGWISAYGCAERLLVKNGDVVTKGQSIAEIGQTGKAKQPQLYFELRKDKKTVDPLARLGS